MNMRTSAVIGTLGLLLVAGGAAAEDAPHAQARIPITGTVSGKAKGTFTGTLSVQRFALEGDHIVAVGMIAGSITDKNGTPVGSGVVGPVEVPVTASAGGAAATEASATAAAARVQAQATCGVLHLDLGALNFDLLGLQVATQPIGIDLSGSTDSPLGNLVCTALSLVNNVVDLVGVLNSILGLLTGLLGGLGA
jgi:hypothetical protein